jgi:hypothetical protein
MTRTKRIYNQKPDKIFRRYGYDDKTIRYKQVCMGHCKNCKHLIIERLKRKHQAFLREIESRAMAWI